MNKYMDMAKKSAFSGISCGDGGPFGAVIVKDGKVISVSHNEVLASNDPTAHAEVVAIRDACRKLGTYDLSGCVIYSSCEPCPMCLSAIIWANIKEVYYGCDRKDAKDIGFRDDFIYEFLEGKNTAMNVQCIDREECLEVFDKYKSDKGTIY